MSTLKVTNIQATGETVNRAVSGVAAAWTNFDAPSSNTIRSSLNTSSVTDNGTGNYDFNYTNSFSLIGNYNGIAGVLCSGNIGEGLKCSDSTTSTLEVRTHNASNNAADRHINVTNHGDLA